MYKRIRHSAFLSNRVCCYTAMYVLYITQCMSCSVTTINLVTSLWSSIIKQFKKEACEHERVKSGLIQVQFQLNWYEILVRVSRRWLERKKSSFIDLINKSIFKGVSKAITQVIYYLNPSLNISRVAIQNTISLNPCQSFGDSTKDHLKMAKYISQLNIRAFERLHNCEYKR